jgi:FAD/FMN-containing dehydrogenase
VPTGPSAGSPPACRGEIERRYPKLLRRVGGYNLDQFVDDGRPFNLARLMVGSEGTLGVVLEAKVRLVPLPAAKAVLAIEFADLLDALAATPAILAHGPSAVEVMDRFVLNHTVQNAAWDRMRRTIIPGDPGALLCVEFYADREADLPPRLEALEADLARRAGGARGSCTPWTMPRNRASGACARPRSGCRWR